jgi:hypothetical protein
VAFVLIVRFVLFVPITVVGLLLMLTCYGGPSRMFGARPRPEGGGATADGVSRRPAA